jgi:hypothetical protein
MNLQLLIDAIIRQTTVLIAQLATAQGVRAPLAHVANQVFLDLANELNAQGVSRKVSADMFGMALRTYLRKIQRLSESSTDGGRSLWEAVLAFLDQGRVVTRAEVLRRFHQDDAELVRGVLHDLCESSLVFRTGTGPATSYRVAATEELASLGDEGSGYDELIWALVYREGPLGRDALSKLARTGDLDAVLARLISAGRVHTTTTEGELEYYASEFIVPKGSPVGWEAAVFDHFQAVVKTIAQRVGGPADGREQQIGGSTYSFDVWPGHPHEREALQQLSEFRARTSALREKIREHNRAHPHPPSFSSITLYAGQSVIDGGADDDAGAAAPGSEEKP